MSDGDATVDSIYHLAMGKRLTTAEDMERGRRIAERRAAIGLTQEELAELMGVTRGSPGNWERGGGLSRTNAMKLAKILGTDLDFYIDGERNEALKLRIDNEAKIPSAIGDEPIGIPIAGIVEAGVFRRVDLYDYSQDEHVPAAHDPRFPGCRHMAYRVEGDSMNLANIHPGDVIIAVDWIDCGFEPKEGMRVIVERTRFNGQEHELTVKELHLRQDGVELRPRSSNPKHEPIFVPWGNLDNGEEVRIVALAVSRIEPFPV